MLSAEYWMSTAQPSVAYGQVHSELVCCKHKTHLLSGTAAGRAFCPKLHHLPTLWLSHWPSEQGPEIELEDLHWSAAALCTQLELWTGRLHPVSVGSTVRVKTSSQYRNACLLSPDVSEFSFWA